MKKEKDKKKTTNLEAMIVAPTIISDNSQDLCLTHCYRIEDIKRIIRFLESQAVIRVVKIKCKN